MRQFVFVDSKGNEVGRIPTGTVPSSKRELRKLFTQWKHGNISKRQIDTAMGLPQWGGKKITQLWEEKLGIRTFSNGVYLEV
jgi:hypothetical protein